MQFVLQKSIILRAHGNYRSQRFEVADGTDRPIFFLGPEAAYFFHAGHANDEASSRRRQRHPPQHLFVELNTPGQASLAAPAAVTRAASRSARCWLFSSLLAS